MRYPQPLSCKDPIWVSSRKDREFSYCFSQLKDPQDILKKIDQKLRAEAPQTNSLSKNQQAHDVVTTLKQRRVLTGKIRVRKLSLYSGERGLGHENVVVNYVGVVNEDREKKG